MNNNSGKKWNEKEIALLRQLATANRPTRLIAHELQRSEDAVRSKASEQHISLKPTNQSPYNRKK
jgi:hypothetical protein